MSWQQGTQSAISLPVPGSDSLFYIFTARMHRDISPMFYYIVDMSLNNSLGDIIDIDTLAAGIDAADQIQAVYLKNKEDYWVVTRKHHEDKYAAFLVTSEGVNPQPVLSPAPNTNYLGQDRVGFMKFSYDKKYFATCFYKDVEICKFDVETGVVEYLFKFRLRDLVPNNPAYVTNNCEFSPCSKYMYLGGTLHADSNTHVFQMDMQYIEDSVLFEQSIVEIGDGQGRNLQLASDGKIYLFYRDAAYQSPVNDYVGVIHNPEKHGLACNHQPNAFLLNNGRVSYVFVNFATDFLFRFDYEGICESDTFTFDPWFFPEPDFIEWNFGDPLSGGNNTSTTPHAKHVFSDGGIYEVSVHVEYPGGRIEETSRKVEVVYSPEPDLGADTIICYSNEIILNAQCGEHFYSWSTGAFGTSQIIVSDTGWYWVRVENNTGCFEIDSIHICNFPPTIAGTNNLHVIPTTCGGSMGAVTGLEITGSPPFSYSWTNDLGDTISNDLDIFHLGVGNYTLHITDSNGCNTLSGPYTIHDAGDVLIEDVLYSSEYCNQQNGSITITATSGLTDMLFYSLDNGGTYSSNQGIFTGLPAGSYAVRVKDS
ncbi:MAG: PKD domain-containing protein, partial [Bacteroidota bacterium]|nr:PKD domain-containing protein [Bacteroidota bacterium]